MPLRFGPFWPLLVRMRRNGHETISGRIFNPKIELPMGCFLFDYEFWQRFRHDFYVFCAKNCFRYAKFSQFGDIGGGVKFFWRNPQKAHPCLISRILSHRSCKSVHGFSLQACARKKEHYKKSQRGYISRICGEFPTQPNSIKIGIRVGVADVINRTTFGNDRSREYKVTEGRILACSIGMACRI